MVGFIEVVIPRKNIITMGEDGQKNIKAPTDLIETQAEILLPGANNIKIETYNKEYFWKVAESNTSSIHKIIYAYKYPIKSGKSTKAVFDKIKICNYTENQFDGNEKINIDIHAHGIQANWLQDKNTGVIDGKLPDKFTETQAKAIWSLYANQNSYNF